MRTFPFRFYRWLLAGIFLLSGALFGFRPVSVSEVSGQTDVAIGGYDTVAYHTEGKAVQGRAIFRHEWQGAYWYFSNPSNRDQFATMPERFAPAYGGYCGLCVSANEEAATGGNPEIFIIFENRLYLLQSEAVLAQWKSDLRTHAQKADEIYARLISAPQEPGESP